MKLGETYLVRHLWVVASLPTDNGSVVAVNVTSWYLGCDETCVLNNGDHPLVTHKSVIAYERGLLWGPETQAKFKADAKKASVGSALLARIQNGALKSDQTPQEIQEIVRSSIAEQAAGQQKK